MKCLHVGAVLLLAATVRIFAALTSDGLVPPYGYAEVTVAGQTNVTGLAVSGTLEKRGAGSLTLTNLYSLPGTVIVREGTVTLAESGLPSSLPTALQRGLAFWVDANTNVVLSGSANVEKWLDVREASTNAPYAYMRAEHDYAYYSEGTRSRKPSRVQGNASVNSLPMVDFGTFGAINSNAAWLPWRKADGTRGVLTAIRAVFAVAAFPDSNGFLISDWDYTAVGGETNTVGTGHFWLGSEINAKKYFRLFQNTAEAYKGTTYMNGVHVESGTRAPDVLGHVFETLTASPLTAANFFNGRNIDGYGGTFPHIGGGGVGEVLIYTNVLTETERLAIESYLLRKWKSGGQVGAHRVEAGATLITVVGAGATNKVSGISGDGRWRKTGAGAVSLANELSLMYGDIHLEEGTLIDGGYVRRSNRLFTVPDAGLVVRAETNRWEILSTAATNALVKTGAGELTVTGFPQSVAGVVVNGGTLRLTQALHDPERAETVTIYNNSFEIYDNHDNHGPWPSASPETWGFLPPGTGWTPLGYASPSDQNNTSAGGIYKSDSSAAIWCVQQPAPDGEWVAFIKQGGGWQTSFDVSSEGRYRLVFFSASRAGSHGGHRCNILLDGSEIAHLRPRRTIFERKAFTLPWLSQGQHTLTFQGVNEGPDLTSAFDDVRIEKIEAAAVIGFVTNGCFEVSAPVTDFDVGNTADPGNYSYTYVVTNAGWDFFLSGVHRSGITEDYSPFLSQRLAAEGTRCAFLMQQGVLSTMVYFPTNGVYDLSYLTSARFDWSIKDPANIYYNLHDYRIKLDGAQVGTWVTYKKYFERVTLRLPAITNAPVSKELRFEGINTLTGDRTSLFDDVRVTRLTEGDPLKDSRFEMPAGALANGDTWENGITNTAWTFDLGAGMRNMSGITRNGSAWRCPNAPEGAAMAVLQMAANMSQPLTFAEGGAYTLSFMATGRMRDYPRYYLHDFRILFNGEEVGYVQTVDETWRRYTFRLPYVKAGVTNSLVFDGINSIYNQMGLADDHASFIDDVRITKQTAASGTGTPGAYKNVTVRLEADSKLALDFPGRVTFKELWYDGRLYSGERNSSNTPFLTGVGSVYVSPKGTLIRIF